MRVPLTVLLALVLAACGGASSEGGAADGEDAVAAIQIDGARAHWLGPGLIAWDAPEGVEVYLIGGGADGIVPAGPVGRGYPAERAGTVADAFGDAYPHLGALPLWRFAVDDTEAKSLLRGGVSLEAVTRAPGEGARSVAATRPQIGAVLDALYSDAALDAPLGVTWDGGTPTLSVWAPTARKVRLRLFGEGDGHASLEMTRDDASGVWSVTGAPEWDRRRYLYEVRVHVPGEGVVTNLVTDPYSHAVTADGERSIIVDLGAPDLVPEGWDADAGPRPGSPVDAAIYELHVRDFSIGDRSVPLSSRGKFGAFAQTDTVGTRHLAALAEAGLTHVHLLPAFDFATVPERAADQTAPEIPDDGPASEGQQAAVSASASNDGFNWGYDPHHYTVPEGSYATDPDGVARIYEFREMVAGLERLGLGTVMDVVYNHTTAHGQDARSVLDRIVPGYYHRLEADGSVAMSTCCSNTASERAMMERLILDSVETWATRYGVDGFRFDLMGHHGRGTMLAVRRRLAALPGGSSILLYGEGWNFGEVADDARFVQATQVNMAGTGIATFNDRMRDAARGGGYDDQGEGHVETQGFASGLYTDPNAPGRDADADRAELLRQADLIRAGLAGSVADYAFETRNGTVRTAAEVAYGDAPAGYTDDPTEAVNYVAAHDNETLFDILAYKLPQDASPETRVRMQTLASSLVALAQGVPLFHAGQDVLRSKSLDRNSYDSGDWFNRLDFTGQDNGWGRGLPPRRENAGNWRTQARLLADERIGVGPSEVAAASERFRAYLRVRDAEPLLRLRTGQAVRENVHFLNTGPDQTPGLIVMALGPNPKAPDLVAMFNARADAALFGMPDADAYAPHPLLAMSGDPALRAAGPAQGETPALAVPARTTAVFVRR